MTLHWWMHWFWVTALCLLVSAQHSDGRTIPMPSPVELTAETSTDSTDTRPEAAQRQPKAMYIQSKPPPPPPPPALSTSTTPLSVELKPTPNAKETNESIALNDTQSVSDATIARMRDNLTKQEIEAPTTSDTDIGVTEQAWALDTTLSDNSPVVGDLVEASEPAGHTVEDTRIRAGAVAGISLGAVAVATLGGTVAFLLYRRRYLNKPQTLNDKCSNPDSSGYLDDSTVPENSEEMYSLDNDSFLNSLEAMTIQNYWTESVKHSKL